MSKQRQEIKRHHYRLAFSDALNDQILEAIKRDEYAMLRPCQFVRHLVSLGMEEYKARIQREKAKREARDQEAAMWQGRASDEGANIIPFPGVSLPETGNFQNWLDIFLREMGYIE